MDEQPEAVWLTYREAARRVKRSIRSINRWRRGGMPMRWATRDGQRVRVVEETVLLKWFRERMDSNPAHQWWLRSLQRAEDEGSEHTAQPSTCDDTP